MTIPTLELNSGTSIPQIGLGLWKVKSENDCVEAVKFALDAGYRHFDTAQTYLNEQFVGEAIAKSEYERSDLFITTKIQNENQFWEDVIPSFDTSLEKLQTDYVDLLLIHFPVSQTRTMAWRRLEQLYTEGRAKAIGVSNYTIKHLEELMSKFNIVPAVNQVELHVFLQQTELVEFCKANKIVVEAYSPLAHGIRMDDPKIMEIAEKHHKSVSQIMLRWLVEQELVILPKSIHQKRIIENIEVFNFRLDADDMMKIESCEDDFRTCWDPSNIA